MGYNCSRQNWFDYAVESWFGTFKLFFHVVYFSCWLCMSSVIFKDYCGLFCFLRYSSTGCCLPVLSWADMSHACIFQLQPQVTSWEPWADRTMGSLCSNDQATLTASWGVFLILYSMLSTPQTINYVLPGVVLLPLDIFKFTPLNIHYWKLKMSCRFNPNRQGNYQYFCRVPRTDRIMWKPTG
jgi:hypothetical protein